MRAGGRPPGVVTTHKTIERLTEVETQGVFDVYGLTRKPGAVEGKGRIFNPQPPAILPERANVLAVRVADARIVGFRDEGGPLFFVEITREWLWG